ncbi:hypothetical protein ACA910_021886 [Epithemia clementina (nom. ined.)]
MGANKSFKKKKNIPGLLLTRLRHWWKSGTKRKGAYVEHKEDSPGGHFPSNDIGDTFSVEEDTESCCQVLLKKQDSSEQVFDKSPWLSREGSDRSQQFSREGHSFSSSTSGIFFFKDHFPAHGTSESADDAITPSKPIEIDENDDYYFDGSSRFVRNTTQDSKQASLESLDSLAWSYLEDESFATPRMANIGEPQRDALGEHVHFLRVQTQPRQVELVWKEDQH